ncbi:ABC transporter ATP-binding protein [Pontibacter vulgaris]|uniref:ABC transporter ATP-binding protein n=1 Tax=Pontibacter vulgaris TaxID=2905679 RepID=UPI001FA74FBF|nr:ABC transporter ATP-binding protein [Pontibacter vulgaris]
MNLLEVSGIRVEENNTVVLQDINFSQKEFQKIAIAGETGSGKSTLLQTIAGLVEPVAGKVVFDNETVIGPAEKLVPGHPGISYLSQHFELPPFLRVEQILKYANTLPTGEAEKLYELCHINHLMLRKTNQLSGGEKQRIALARLLLSQPRLLLLDEPFSNLDMVHKSTLKTVIQAIGEELDITCILISHDPLDTLSWADEIMVMKDGQIIQKGNPEQIYRKPVNTYAAGLFGNYNLIPASKANTLAVLPGIKPDSKAILIRPESFKLTADTKNTLTGLVQKVKFYGSYHELEVLVSDVTVSIKTGAFSPAESDIINFTVSAADICYLEV